MIKVPCNNCLTTGFIKAFGHVKGGVCFRCAGHGYFERKTEPLQQFWFKCFGTLDGEFILICNIKAPSEKQALTKWTKSASAAFANGAKYDLSSLKVEIDLNRLAI